MNPLRIAKKNSRSRNSRVGREAGGEVSFHGRRGRVTSWLRRRLRHLRVGSVAAAALQARETATISTLALHNRFVGLRPHLYAFEGDAVTRSTVCTNELDRRTLYAINNISVPVLY